MEIILKFLHLLHTWITDPITQIMFVFLVVNSRIFITKYKESKEQNNFKRVYQVAKETFSDFIKADMNNPDHQNKMIMEVYSRLPLKYQTISADLINSALLLANAKNEQNKIQNEVK